MTISTSPGPPDSVAQLTCTAPASTTGCDASDDAGDDETGRITAPGRAVVSDDSLYQVIGRYSGGSTPQAGCDTHSTYPLPRPSLSPCITASQSASGRVSTSRTAPPCSTPAPFPPTPSKLVGSDRMHSSANSHAMPS